jgi:hypothetical protein
MATPMVAISITVVSGHLLRLSAATMPSGTPRATTQMTARRPVLHGDWQAISDHGVDRDPRILEGRAEIEGQDALEIAQILRPDRLIEAIFGVEGCLNFGCQHAFGDERTAGHGVHEEKRQRDDGPEGHKHHAEALGDIGRHSSAGSGGC